MAKDKEKYTNPKNWGPYFWFMMKCIAYNYPANPSTDDKQKTADYFCLKRHDLLIAFYLEHSHYLHTFVCRNNIDLEFIFRYELFNLCLLI